MTIENQDGGFDRGNCKRIVCFKDPDYLSRDFSACLSGWIRALAILPGVYALGLAQAQQGHAFRHQKQYL